MYQNREKVQYGYIDILKKHKKVQYGYIDTLKNRKNVQYGYITRFLGAILAINNIFNPVNNED